MVLVWTKLHYAGFFLGLMVLHFAGAQRNTGSQQSSWLSMGGNAVGGWIESFLGMLAGGRIYGGTTENISQRPYMAYIAYHPVAAFRTKLKIALCSGTILTKKKILTAASCFSVLDGTDKSVYVGATAVNNKYNKGTGNQYEIESKVIYDFNSTKYEFGTNPFLHDLAIVTLKTEMTLSTSVAAATLPGATENLQAFPTSYADKAITIVGYGLDQDITGQLNSSSTVAKQALKSLKSQNLKSASTTGLTDRRCGDELGSYLASNPNFTSVTVGPFTYTKTNISEGLEKSTCPELLLVKGDSTGPCLFGDNGGPMLDGTKVVGVLSIILACANNTKASVGNELSGSHLAWVRANAN